jgi:beta-glucosidase
MTAVPDDELRTLVGKLELKTKVALLTGQDSWSMRALPEVGLASIVMSDGPAGVRGRRWDERDPSVCLPSPTAVAASWDIDVVRAVGDALGSEARRKGVHVLLAPMINIQRTPFGGRHFETFSEEPVLTATVATAYVRGVQAHGVAATVKHYVANDSETDRFSVDVQVADRVLREVYLQAFEHPVIDGGALAVMSAYNSVNGITATENPLLTTPLRDEWGFDGVVISDWTAVRSIEAARQPQDVAMPGPDGAWGEQLLTAVLAGQVDERLIDEKVLRIFRLASRVGALTGFPVTPMSETPSYADLRSVARRTAAEGMVLLRNDDALLPLGPPASIAVIGEGALAARIQGGGSATVVPADVVSPLEGLRARWPHAEVTWALGTPVRTDLAPFDEGTYTAPDGEPGLLVRFLDDEGVELAREVRLSSSLVWFDGASLATEADEIEISFRWEHGSKSSHTRLGLAGLADIFVAVEGRAAGSLRLRTLPGDDPATVVLNPPVGSVELPLSGPVADVVVRFRPVAGGMPDAMALKVGLPPVTGDDTNLIRDATRAAASAEVAVVVVGTTAAAESEGFDRTSLALSGNQNALVKAVVDANPRTVVVVNSGAPVVLPWRTEVGAVLAAWFPGQEFGHALADVLSGDVEPGGRLPVTWPSSEQDVPVRQVQPEDGVLQYREGLDIGDRAWRRAGIEPAFGFGHGLGYTTWDLSSLSIGPTRPGHDVELALDVVNSGRRAGKTVVQVYLERTSASAVERPMRWLAAFSPVRLQAGGEQRLHLTIPARRFAHWADGWQIEPGTYRVVVGLSSRDDRLETRLTLEEPA